MRRPREATDGHLREFLATLREFDLTTVVHDACKARGATIAEVIGPTHARHAVAARKDVYRIIKQRYPLWSSTKIASLFKRDGSAIRGALLS